MVHLCGTLVLSSERDFGSRPADREKLAHDLVHASAQVVVILHAIPFVQLDRLEMDVTNCL